jgi:hypothetical protein
VASSSLRKENDPEMNFKKFVISKGINKQQLVGDQFPANPIYLSLLLHVYDETCTTLTRGLTSNLEPKLIGLLMRKDLSPLLVLICIFFLNLFYFFAGFIIPALV